LIAFSRGMVALPIEVSRSGRHAALPITGISRHQPPASRSSSEMGGTISTNAWPPSP
jgi:hypothetical protein